MEETAQTYNAIYGDRTWEQITLGEMINKGGAAGRIFRVKGHPQLVAKIFHNLNKSSANREKLQAMLLNRPSFSPAMKDGKRFTMEDGNNYIQIAWPEALLENEYGFCVGYLMPLIDLSQAASLDHFMQKAIRQKLKLTEKYEHRLQAAYNLCTMVAALHEKGHYIVGLKPSNVYVYKQSMLIAILDCDGFSIRGENGRYPAEFVSEEYIYPEGMKQNCDQMGEEQDKFALAVILFKLLNNGIHPFSGVPRKQGVPNLTIQERIAAHHYAYGSWADLYQAPHPYSIHDYFAKDTLELFDRAFVKGMKRPSAAEWERHLRNLLQNLRPCKKNPDHAYFTSKGCGLCLMEEKFKSDMRERRAQLQTPKTVRGLEIENMTPEKMEAEKQLRHQKLIRANHITAAAVAVYLVFFGMLHFMFAPLAETLTKAGIGLQMIGIILIMSGIHKIFKKIRPKVPLFRYDLLPLLLEVYAFICMLVTLIAVNRLPLEILALAP